MYLDHTLEGFWLSRRRDMSVHTQRDYGLTFRRLAKYVGEKPFEKITAQDLDGFLNHLRDDLGLSQKTVLNHWVALSALWTWAENTLGLPHILRGKVKMPEPKKTIRKPFTHAEVKAMIDACDWSMAWDAKHRRHVRASRPSALRDRTIILVLVDSGIRASELSDLKVKDYDRKQGKLTIRSGKGDKEREVFIGETARQSLWRYLAERQTKPNDYLFVTRNGEQIDRINLLHLIQRIGDRAEVTNAHPHRFRHTFAINYLRNGGNVLGLQAMLGHEDLDTVRIYARMASVDLQESQRTASPADNWRL